MCVAYDVDGVRHDEMPMTQTEFHHAKPIYEYFDGWREDISGCRELRRPARTPRPTCGRSRRCPAPASGASASAPVASRPSWCRLGRDRLTGIATLASFNERAANDAHPSRSGNLDQAAYRARSLERGGMTIPYAEPLSRPRTRRPRHPRAARGGGRPAASPASPAARAPPSRRSGPTSTGPCTTPARPRWSVPSGWRPTPLRLLRRHAGRPRRDPCGASAGGSSAPSSRSAPSGGSTSTAGATAARTFTSGSSRARSAGSTWPARSCRCGRTSLTPADPGRHRGGRGEDRRRDGCLTFTESCCDDHRDHARPRSPAGLGDAVVIGLGSMIGAGVFAAFGPAARAAGTCAAPRARDRRRGRLLQRHRRPRSSPRRTRAPAAPTSTAARCSVSGGASWPAGGSSSARRRAVRRWR